MRIFFLAACSLLIIVFSGCNSIQSTTANNQDKIFAGFENRFLDAYWKQHPSQSIFNGYNKYYENLEMPDSSSFVNSVIFSKQWTDSLNRLDYDKLSENNKISLRIIRNRLESDTWYTTTFKQQEWDASQYNISGECDYIINQPYAALDERLTILTKHLQFADQYYKSALKILHKPVKEYIEMAINQNQGGLSVLGASLADSIKASHLSNEAKDSLRQNITKATGAINDYVKNLKSILDDKTYQFRDFRIGKTLYDQKFKFDLVTDLTPEEVYAKAMADKKMYHDKMFFVADSVWDKYYKGQKKPADSIQLVQSIMDKIQLQHASPKDFFDSLANQLHRLKRFILEKKLFDFDTISPPVEVRIMPAYERGFTVANAEFSPPYRNPERPIII